MIDRDNLNEGLVPPQAIDLEKAILGAILLEKNAILICLPILSAEMFYKEAHRLIFETCVELSNASAPIDILTVVNALKSKEKLRIANPALIADLTSRVVGTSNLEYHSRIVAEKYTQRSLIEEFYSYIKEAYSDSCNINNLLSRSASTVSKLLMSNQIKKTLKFSDVVSDVIKKVANAKESKELSGIPTSLQVLDRRTGGWQDTDLIILAARPAMGKDQPLYSKIATPDGWITMGEAKVGKKILSSCGGIQEIIGVYPQGKREVYRVYFDDDTYADCGLDHLWLTHSRSERKSNKEASAKSLKDIIDSGLYVGNRKNHSISIAKPLNFSGKRPLLDPYLLGVLIGDGCLSKNAVKFQNCEIDIVDRCYDRLFDKETYSLKSDGVTHSILKRKDLKKPCVHQELEKYKLLVNSHKKFIPKEYLISDIQTRLDLLRGLVDTDGHVVSLGTTMKGNFIEYSTTSFQLARDIKELVQSLGGKCTYKKRKGFYTKNGVKIKAKNNYRVWFSMPNGMEPFYSWKHKKRYIGNKKYHKKFIVDVKKIGFEETQCISVSSLDKQYITDNCILTHNTAAALQFATYPVFQFGKRVMVFSLEMSIHQLVSRILSQELEINSNHFTKDAKKMDMNYLNKKLGEHGYVYNDNLIIDDTPGLDIADLRAKAKAAHLEEPIHMIIVDYLQLMTDRTSSKNREQEISSISRQLKGLAKDLGVPVIALSQLSRAVESRGGERRPQLSDLRESGSIEQDADIVIFLNRPEYYGITEDEDGQSLLGVAKFIIAKYRGGSTGDDYATFRANITKFEDIETYEEQKTFSNIEPNKQFESYRQINDDDSDDIPF